LEPKKEFQLQAFRELDSQLRILNAYGPTEVTYGATAYEFISMIDPDRDVPIGIPFPNYQVYIVDKYFQPVPIGVTGELLIGGIGISRGYAKRPSITAEKFIPDLFSGRQGGRLYRTGDMVRFLSDGNIEFLGRSDFQVKIRGHRIELGEIESVMRNIHGMKKAVVTVQLVSPGDHRLVAYVEPYKNMSLNKTSIREYLSKYLPNYMVPNFIIMMEEIPTLPNGKINRNALTAPDINEPDLIREIKKPRNDCERLILEIWKSILNINEISIQDDFFELGGHSLMATQIVTRIRNQFGVDLSLRIFFDKSSIEQLSNHILSQPSLEG
jgi:acyl-coenzyme A synthetase/AMP-(fatty) acid ligase/acyl carrier protein